MVSLATFTVANIAHTPITTIRLKILEPTTLLTASSLLPTREADTLTAVSGSDVPIATIVSPIMIDGTCSLLATLELPSTNRSAPLINNVKPITRNTSTRTNGASLINFSIFFSFFSFPRQCCQPKSMPKQKGKASALLLSRYITAISYKIKKTHVYQLSTCAFCTSS